MDTTTIMINGNIGEITEEMILVAVIDHKEHTIDESKAFSTDGAAREYAVAKMKELDPEMTQEAADNHYTDGFYDNWFLKKTVYVTTTILHRH